MDIILGLMRKDLLIFILSLFSVTLFAQKEVVIPKGTDVFVKTTDSISSTSRIKKITGYIENDVVVDGYTVIKAETPVVIDVSCRKRHGIGKPGKVKLEGVHTQTVDGKILAVKGSAVEKGNSSRGKSIGLTVGMMFLMPPFNFLFLLIKGDNCVVKPMVIPMKTKEDFTVTLN